MKLFALLLLSHLTAQQAETRIIQPPAALVLLVGQPCDEPAAKLIATLPLEQLAGQKPGHEWLSSQPFACPRDCTVGVRVKNGAQLVSFTIGTASAHGKGRLASSTSPPLFPARLKTCNGESIADAVMSPVPWAKLAGIAFVSDITFADGTSWHIDRDAVITDALRAWMIQPKERQ